MKNKFTWLCSMVFCAALACQNVSAQNDSVLESTKVAYEALLKRQAELKDKLGNAHPKMALTQKQVELLKKALQSMQSATKTHDDEALKKHLEVVNSIAKLKVELEQLMQSLGKAHPRVKSTERRIDILQDFLSKTKKQQHSHNPKHNWEFLNQSLAKAREQLKKHPHHNSAEWLKKIKSLQDAIRADQAMKAIELSEVHKLHQLRLDQTTHQLELAKKQKAEMDHRLQRTHQAWLKLHAAESEMAQIHKIRDQNKKLERSIQEIEKRTERIEKMLQKLLKK